MNKPINELLNRVPRFHIFFFSSVFSEKNELVLLPLEFGNRRKWRSRLDHSIKAILSIEAVVSVASSLKCHDSNLGRVLGFDAPKIFFLGNRIHSKSVFTSQSRPGNGNRMVAKSSKFSSDDQVRTVQDPSRTGPSRYHSRLGTLYGLMLAQDASRGR